MSLTGKILAVLNILGALGFLALAGMDYGKRQSWAYANFLHDVAIKGLPLDADERDAEGQKIVSVLGEQGKKDLFNGQQPIGTQVEEVEEYKKKLGAAVAAAGSDKPVQMAYLARLLTTLAGSNAQRERLLSIRTHLADAKAAEQLKKDLMNAAKSAADTRGKPAGKTYEDSFAEALEALHGVPRTPFAEAFLAVHKETPTKPADQIVDDALEQMRLTLLGDFEAAFDPALKGQLRTQGTTGVSLTPDERKSIIASLLFNLTQPYIEVSTGQQYPDGQGWDVTAGPYKRYLTVVGLEAANLAINKQGQVLTQMVTDLSAEISRERSVFVATHQGLVAQLEDRASQLASLMEKVNREQTLVAEQKSLVERRKKDIVVGKENLAQLNEQAKTNLEQLKSMSDELYKVRIATRNAGEANQKYEQKIRTLEVGR